MPDFLGKELEGVESNSPLDTDDDHLEPELDDEPIVDTEGEELNSSDDGDDDEEKKQGRTPENIYRELSRKQEKFQRDMTKQFTEVVGKLTDAVSGLTKQPDTQGGNSLDQMSIDQLRQLRNREDLSPEQRTQLNDYLTERIINEEVEARTSVFTQNQQFELRRVQANQRAVDRYPELKNTDSEFREAVLSELHSRGGESYAKSNPTAVLDVANEIAAEMGIQPNVAVRGKMRRTPVQPHARRGGKPVKANEAETISDEKAKQIADRLEATTGVKFDLQKIKERHKLYSKHKDLFIK